MEGRLRKSHPVTVGIRAKARFIRRSMSKSGSDVETDLSKVNMDRGGNSKRERSRDVVAVMEKRLSKMEIAVVEFNQRLEEDVLTKGGFEAVADELQGQFQGVLNSTLDGIKLDHFLGELTYFVMR
ncbi:hypothetical protein L3X38_004915 [Prunus dulcis]|uniref:Uncharacterized protein n=1 Tax=Prunus dulcis TaxID=3755 RepID=A0AAD5F3M5_PRUDU|nr:hypothetical protein L3X38_004915 [Prunus dulcis]